MHSNLWRELFSGVATVELKVSNALFNRLKKAKQRFHSTDLIKDVFGSFVLIRYMFNRKALFALATLPIYPSAMAIKKNGKEIIVLLSIGDVVKNEEIDFKNSGPFA